MGSRGPKPKCFNTNWSENLSYAVGLLASDGCLSKDGRHIELTSKDEEQIETFKNILGIQNILTGTKKGGYAGGFSYHVQFGSVLFYSWLVGIGLSPKKSCIIKELDIPEKYFADFLRGLFDGDGSIYSYRDSRWKNSFMFYVEFSSASPDFIKWLQERNKALYGVRGVVLNGNNSRKALILRYAKKESRILLSNMYRETTSPRLSRKFAKIQKILTIDSGQDAQVAELVYAYA